jgi:hypothetical protein
VKLNTGARLIVFFVSTRQSTNSRALCRPILLRKSPVFKEHVYPKPVAFQIIRICHGLFNCLVRITRGFRFENIVLINIFVSSERKESAKNSVYNAP